MRRYLRFISLLLLTFWLSMWFAHAWFWEEISNMIMEKLYDFLWIAITVCMCFMVWLGTFVILFISTIIDIFLFQVPSLWIFLWEDKGLVYYLVLVTKVESFILLFAVVFWLIGWWYRTLIDVKDMILYWNSKNWKSYNIFYDIIKKVAVIALIAQAPLLVIPLKYTINVISSTSITYLASTNNSEDKYMIQKLPLTSLLLTWLGLPITERWYGETSTEENSKNIFSDTESSNNYSKITTFILGRANYNMLKFWDLYDYLKEANIAWEKDTLLNKVQWLDESSITSEVVSVKSKSSMNAIIQFSFFCILYLGLMLWVLKQTIDLVFKLVTRFIKVIFWDFFLIIHIFLLSTDTSEHVGRRNILSYIWDVLVTLFASIILWMAIIFFAVLVGGFWITADTFNFWVADSESLDVGVVFIMFILMLFLFGILNFLNKFLESVGANFEYYVSKEQNGGIKDSYSDSSDASNSANQIMWLWQTVGTAIWAVTWYSAVKWVTNMANKAIYQWGNKSWGGWEDNSNNNWWNNNNNWDWTNWNTWEWWTWGKLDVKE